ncbi:MAG TPA: pyruvate dehydrogenase complex dihydrolipoamide acetyltransferase [Longimicrobium sp.]|jgi:pyruvate dehydrogenase E2 component (dihydrolipoamide acetyltransferase)
MATKVYMEALSPTMEEGRISTWLKNEGDEVKEGDVLAEVETDKATMELVARGSGVLRKRMIGDGDTANVGVVIAVIGAADEDVSALTGGGDAPAAPAKAPEAAAPAPAAPAPAAQQAEEVPAQPAAPATPAPAAQAESGAPAGGGDGRVKASPLARRMAADAGVDVGSMRGSGPGGRIIRRDVEAAMQAGGAQQQPAQPQAAAPAPQPQAAASQPAAGGRDVPVSQMRKAIAKRLSMSSGPVPHFYLTVEIDMGEAMKMRGRINERFAADGVKVSPNDLVIRAVAGALRRHPWVNASWQGDTIRMNDRVNIGVAVAVEEGLITPVIFDADRKGVAEISREVKELAGRAREKKLKPEEYTGSTFSISNLGMFGIEEFTAVLNPPEAAIMAIGASVDKVVAVDGEMQIRPRMRVTLTCDHRVIDGATGAEFLRTFKSYLEDPMLMIA